MKAFLRPLTWLAFAALAFSCQPVYAQASCATTSSVRGLSTKTVVYGRDSAVAYRVFQDSIRTRCKPALTDTVWKHDTVAAVVPAVPIDTAKPVVVPPPPVTSVGTLAALTFEDGTFGGLTDGGGGLPPGGKVVSSACYAGSKCLDFSAPASSSDQGISGYWVSGTRYTDLWVSFALNVLASPTSGGVETQKMLIFRDLGNAPNQFGELVQAYGAWAWSWLFTESGPNYPVAIGGTAPGWHTYKVHLHCAAPAKVTFGKDGQEGVASFTTAGAACAHLPNAITFGGTLNASSGASHFVFDNIKIGTTDPGWP
jgi:hypothetical protein